MKVFILGWEFPPFISGGLGTTCYGLTRAMDRLGIEVLFVLPRIAESRHTTHVELLTQRPHAPGTSSGFHELKNARFHTIHTPLQPYTGPERYQRRIEETLRRRHKERDVDILSVSHFTRNIIVGRYSVVGDKVEVVYKGVERNGSCASGNTGIKKDEKIVLFLDRITTQKARNTL